MQIEGSVFAVSGAASGLGAATAAMLVRSLCENPMLNGATIRLDGALRMAPR